MKKVQKLVKIIKEKFGIELDANSFQRTRCGYWQRASGAWSWKMNTSDNIFICFGSCETVTTLLKNKEQIFLNGKEIYSKNV